uniref:Uncharacterized protein n=1 Tax=Arcella intermedia TaxID=1963864 RepID=A0A6B2L0E5_9EUKA
MYSEHRYETTCARLAPSGFYVCSTDKSGRLLIWDCVGTDKVIKLDKQTIGTVYDIAWTEDSKRVAVGGAGREKMGEVFLFDSGSSVGEITGHAQPITSLDIKQTRPYRLATGSEDFKLNWFEGPPFKFKASTTQHTRYVNCVRFSPDGNKVFTAGSDKKCFIYDGKDCKPIGELSSEGAHTGSIFSAAWSPDSKRIATASGDKTVKIWDAESGKLLSTTAFGNDVSDQQVGLLWQGSNIFSVSLQGAVSTIDENNAATPSSVQHGHNKIITSLSYNPSTDKFYTCDSNSYLIEWEAGTGRTAEWKGKPHAGPVAALKVLGDKLVTVATDDTIRFNSLDSREYGQGVDLGGQPSALDGAGNVVVVATHEAIVVLDNQNIVSKLPVKYDPCSIAISPDGSEVVVGGKLDNDIHVYALSGGVLTEQPPIQGHRGSVSALTYSKDGKLAAGDGNREIKVYEGRKEVVSWVYHTSKIHALSWASDNTRLVSGSVDSSAIVWDLSQPDTRVHIKLAHQGGVRGVAFRNSSSVITAGEDCSAKLWDIKF